MYVIGLDLGQIKDYTALAVVKFIQPSLTPRITASNRRRLDRANFHCCHLQRFDLGTPYPVVAREVRNLLRVRPLLDDECHLVVDQTGVGRPVVDMLEEYEISPKGVTITGGIAEGYDRTSGYLVPKRDLVSNMLVLLQNGRLKFAKELPDGQTLMNELLNFQMKITLAGNDTYGAWREQEHDDLVFALGLACWYGEKYCYRAAPQPGRKLSFRQI